MRIARTMALAAILFLFAAFHQAHAQAWPQVLPNIDGTSLKAGPPILGASRNGVWLVYFYVHPETNKLMRVSYVGTLPELSKVGGRLATILKSANPLLSLQTAGNRFPILPLTDPSLAAVVADMNAAIK